MFFVFLFSCPGRPTGFNPSLIVMPFLVWSPGRFFYDNEGFETMASLLRTVTRPKSSTVTFLLSSLNYYFALPSCVFPLNISGTLICSASPSSCWIYLSPNHWGVISLLRQRFRPSYLWFSAYANFPFPGWLAPRPVLSPEIFFGNQPPLSPFPFFVPMGYIITPCYESG